MKYKGLNVVKRFIVNEYELNILLKELFTNITTNLLKNACENERHSKREMFTVKVVCHHKERRIE